LEKANDTDSWKDWISAFIKGPGWFPGTPRLGDPLEVPEIQHRAKYDPKASIWIQSYAILHFLLVFLAWHDLNTYNMDMSLGIVWLICAFLFWTLTAIGLIFDKHPYAWPNEILRCGLILCLFTIFDITWKEFCVTNYYLTIIYSISLAVATSAMIFYPIVEEKAKTQ